MGYTTQFEGRFEISDLPTAEVIVKLRELEGADGDVVDCPGAPSSYCQWVLTKDCRGIEWDHEEKFYDYVEWLQYIIDNVLEPAGLSLNGSVRYQGERMTDYGLLTVEDGKVKQMQEQLLTDTLADLKAFKDFVLQSKWSEPILRAWAEHKKTEGKR